MNKYYQIIINNYKNNIEGSFTVETFENDLKNLNNLKREVSRIYNNNKYNVILTRNMLISLINIFGEDIIYLIKYSINPKHHVIVNTFLFHVLKKDLYLINIDQELLKKIEFELENR